MELEEEDWGDEEDEDDEEEEDEDEDEDEDEGGVVLMEGEEEEEEEEGAEYGSGVEEQSVSLLGLLERRDENRAREAPASGLASGGEGASGGDAKSEDGGGEAGEAGGAGDVEDWARLSNGAVLVFLAGLLLTTYYLLLTTYYLLLSARERVHEGVATGPHHVVGVEREPARHLGVITREHGRWSCTHYITREQWGAGFCVLFTTHCLLLTNYCSQLTNDS